MSEGPIRLGDAIRSLLENSQLGERMSEASIVPEWAERVGAGVAAVTTPLRVSGGTLFVAVRSSAWLMELQLMEGEFLRRLNAGREKGRIKRIRFVMQDGA